MTQYIQISVEQWEQVIKWIERSATAQGDIDKLRKEIAALRADIAELKPFRDLAIKREGQLSWAFRRVAEAAIPWALTAAALLILYVSKHWDKIIGQG